MGRRESASEARNRCAQNNGQAAEQGALRHKGQSAPRSARMQRSHRREGVNELVTVVGQVSEFLSIFQSY